MTNLLHYIAVLRFFFAIKFSANEISLMPALQRNTIPTSP